MKTSWKIGAIIGLVAIIAMAAIGITYAVGTSTYPAATPSKCGFAWVESNDNGTTGTYGAYNPIDPGDLGSGSGNGQNYGDPKVAQSAGQFCSRSTSDIASTTASYSGDTVTFNMNKIYPGYHPTIFFGLSNQSGTPAVVSSITLNNPNSSLFTMTLNGVTLNQTIDNGKEATGALDIGVGNVTPGQSYSFSATIVATQSGPLLFKTTTNLYSLVNPTDNGQTAYFGALVTSSGNGIPTGTVSFYDGATLLGTNNMFFGLSGISTASLTPGSHNITAVYSGDSNYASSTSNIVVQKVRYDTKTTLQSTPNPSNVGQSVKFTATVTELGGTGTPTGNVTLYDGQNSIGTVTLSGGSATLNTSALTAGNHNITVQYNGDNNNEESNSNTVVQVVNKVGTTTALTSSSGTSVYGQAVTFTAKVTPSTATGSVTFKDGSTVLSSNIPLVNGSASYSISTLAAGSHGVTAVYSGDPNYTTSTSSAVTQKVNAASTKAVLTASPNPSTYGQSVTFLATVSAVSPGGGTPSGTVTFKDGGTVLSSNVPLVNGSASYSISTLAVGNHSITAVYSDGTNYLGSTSSAVTQTVGKATTKTVLTASPNPSVFGQPVAFTATVSAVSPGGGTPSGTVTFKDGSTTLASNVALVNGSASYSISTLAVGSHSITAVYNGDDSNGRYNTSTSNTVTQTVVAKPVIKTSLPGGTKGNNYSQTLLASGGMSPFTWSITSGSLPPGLTLNSSSGVINGKPTATGTFGFTVKVIDGLGSTATQGLSIKINN